MKAERIMAKCAQQIRSNLTRDASNGQSNAQTFDDDDSIVDRGNEITPGNASGRESALDAVVVRSLQCVS